MKLGIKVNADSESFVRLSDANPDLAEVWFNANTPDKYTDLFRELQKRHCDVGLHFWGTITHNILPNIAFPDGEVIKQSMSLIKSTIDIAAEHSCRYVNIHPGSSALLTVNYANEVIDMIRNPVYLADSIAVFLENVQILSQYAHQKGIVFTVETVPSRITHGWYDDESRLAPICVYELPAEALVQAAGVGIHIANDFCHTAASIIHDDPAAVWEYVYGVTKKLAPQTRLIHIGFIKPPYNGTDNHDELDNPILNTPHAVPNTTQLLELLHVFQNRHDIWILAEPRNNHVKNFFLVKKLLERLATK